MNWLLASSLMFLSSVILYLLVRKSSLVKIPSQFQNLAMFAVPLLVYAGRTYGNIAKTLNIVNSRSILKIFQFITDLIYIYYNTI